MFSQYGEKRQCNRRSNSLLHRLRPECLFIYLQFVWHNLVTIIQMLANICSQCWVTVFTETAKTVQLCELRPMFLSVYSIRMGQYFTCQMYTLCFSVTWNKWAWFFCPATRTCSQQHAAQPATSPSRLKEGKPGGGCRKCCFEAAAHQKRDQLGERKKLLKLLGGINKEIASKTEDIGRQTKPIKNLLSPWTKWFIANKDTETNKLA